MTVIPKFVVYANPSQFSISFEDEVPKQAIFYAQQRIKKFIGEPLDSATLTKLQDTIKYALMYLVSTRQLYQMGDQWHFCQAKAETSFNYNPLNFQ